MSDLQTLRSMFSSKLVCEITTKHGTGVAILKENDPNAKLKHVEILGLPDESILLDLKGYQQPNEIFSGIKGECKRCDYLLITVLDNKPLLVFFELKSVKLDRSDYVKQFKGVECLIDYCEGVLKRFYDQTQGFKNYQKRFVVFYKLKQAKRSTRPHFTVPSKDHNTPAQAFKYPNPHNVSLKSVVAL